MSIAEPRIWVLGARHGGRIRRLIVDLLADRSVETRDVLLQEWADGLTSQRRRHLLESRVFFFFRASAVAVISRRL
jgi:hypothetical protein